MVQRCLLLLTLWLVCSAAALAQRPGRGGPPFGNDQPGPPWLGWLTTEVFSDGKALKGVPFTATAVTESAQALADGTRITRKTTATLARDSEGRTRRELKLDNLGPFQLAGPPAQMVFINDVVAGAVYILNINEKLAHKMFADTNGPPAVAAPPPAAQGATEALGTQMIEGLECTGTRTTVTLPAGEIGNDRPLQIVSERWESAALQVTIQSKHSDPRVGETTYRLTNLLRSEPLKSLFEVPADFKFVQGGRPNGVGGPPWQRGRKPPGF